MNHKVVGSVLTVICNCQEDRTCIYCQIKEFVSDQEKKMCDVLELNEALKESNQNLIRLHNINIESLLYYWHLLHSDCPCVLGDKKDCKSPWRRIHLQEQLPIRTRAQELQAIEDFIKESNSGS